MNHGKTVFVPAVIIGLALASGVGVYVRIIREQLDLTTGLLFLAAVGVGLLALAEVALRVLKASWYACAAARTLNVITSALLVGLELILRIGLARTVRIWNKTSAAAIVRFTTTPVRRGFMCIPRTSSTRTPGPSLRFPERRTRSGWLSVRSNSLT